MWLIFLLFFKTSFAFVVEFSKTTFKEGEILRVIIRNVNDSEKYICFLDEKPYPLYRIETNTLRTFIGFGTDIKPGTYKFYVKKGTYSPPALNNAKNKILAKAFLTQTEHELWDGDFIWPVSGKITGRYGERRIYKKIKGDNVLTWKGIHSGIDIRGKIHTPVSASNSGKVIIARRFAAEGNTILINHGQGILTLYCHLNKINVKEGDFVKKGEIIGTIGNTGISTAPHLHFGLYIHSIPVNPLNFLK